MKKTVMLLAILLISLGVKAKEFSKEKLYIGSCFGYSKYHKTNFYGNGFTVIGRKPIYNSQCGYGIFLGLQEKDFLAFEIGYNFPTYLKYLDNHYDYAIFKTQGGSFSIKTNFPIYNKINTYTKVGSIVWRADSQGSDQYGNLRNLDGKEYDFGISPFFSLGIEKKLNNNWSTRLEYQWINKIGDKISVGSCPNNSIMNIGLSYSFEEKNNFFLDNQKYSSNIKNIGNHLNTNNSLILKTKIFFDFNKSILRSSEKESLDKLYSQIKSSSINLEKSLIFIIGYTDNIGSEKYNYKLSQDRAKSVVNYFSSKEDFPIKNIIYKGMGKYLAPDHKSSSCRCVEIYIQSL